MSDKTIIFFLLLLVISLLLVIFYQRFILQRRIYAEIRKVSQKLKEIVEQGSDERMMIFTSNKEIIELSSQINTLLEYHVKVRANFLHSEIASKRMLSNISHDMKTPMTVILGYLEMMRLRGTYQEEMVVKTEQKAQDVMDLINEFFTLAKLEAGDTDVTLTKTDICEICRESILDFYGNLTKENFLVEIDVPERAVYAQGNKDAILRILYNLLSNVLRYGSDGKYVGLFVRSNEKYVWIDIVDKGKGIDKAFADSVFDRLFTMEDSRNRKIQGNGLGLTIAKNLALQLGGNITLESIPYERTIFSLQLKKV